MKTIFRRKIKLAVENRQILRVRAIDFVNIGDLGGAITHATRAVTLPKLAAGGTVVRREKNLSIQPSQVCGIRISSSQINICYPLSSISCTIRFPKLNASSPIVGGKENILANTDKTFRSI